MARPKEQSARKRDLVEAAARAILRRGLNGVRIKDVAEEADLSAGLVTYYYPDFEDLLTDVHQDAVDRFYWRRLAAVDRAGDPIAELLALVDQGIPAQSDDELCRVLYEMHLHAARSRTHAVLMTGLYDREVSLYVQVLRSGLEAGVFAIGRSDIDAVAENAVALEDAYGLHVVGRNAHVDPAGARHNILTYLELATGAPLIAASGRPLVRASR